MKKISLTVAALLVCGVAVAQSTDYTIREVRDPVQFRAKLNTDMDTIGDRLTAAETSNVTSVAAMVTFGAISTTGTLSVAGASSLGAVRASGAVNVNGNLTVLTNKFAITAATGSATMAATGKLTMTPVANANVTNGQAVTLSGVINLLTAIGQANAAANTITLANPTAAGQWAVIFNGVASTNKLTVAKTGNFVGTAVDLLAGESAIIFAPSATTWAGVGQ